MTKTNKIFIFIIFVAINMETVMANENIQQPDYYYLSVKTRDVKSAIKINGAPLIQDIEGEGIITSEPVNTWLTVGKNTLSIEMNLLNEKSSPSVEVQLFLHDPSSPTPAPKKILAEFYYPPRDNKQKEKLPYSELILFDFRNDVGTNLWKEADKLSNILENDKKEIIQLINNLEQSLLNKDIISAINIQKYKILDDALSEKKPFEQLENATKKSYEWLNKQTGLISNNITLENSAFAVCCNNMVVFVSRINGDDAIQLESDDLYFDIAIYVSKIKGKWVIVR